MPDELIVEFHLTGSRQRLRGVPLDWEPTKASWRPPGVERISEMPDELVVEFHLTGSRQKLRGVPLDCEPT